MFGISLTEVAMIALVALLVVGPQKLPGMLRTLGEWVRRIRQMTTAVRVQTGIDDILRQEGIDGGLAELRSLVRGDLGSLARSQRSARDRELEDPYDRAVELDRFREYPPEGVDAAGALPDDLVDDDAEAEPAESPEAEARPSEPPEPAAAGETPEPRGGDEAPPRDEAPKADDDGRVERSSTRAPWQTDSEK